MRAWRFFSDRWNGLILMERRETPESSSILWLQRQAWLIGYAIFINMAGHNITGARGEVLAGEFLETLGYEVLERNWRHGRHELDIVARTERELVIVEVKTRSSDQYGQPLEAVKGGKRNKMFQAANAYVQATNMDLALRFDIISVILHPQKPYIHHIPDAFYPTVHARPFQ
jgi:putative endonuclease